DARAGAPERAVIGVIAVEQGPEGAGGLGAEIVVGGGDLLEGDPALLLELLVGEGRGEGALDQVLEEDRERAGQRLAVEAHARAAGEAVEDRGHPLDLAAEGVAVAAGVAA